MPKRQQIDNIILICLAVLDLAFGIVSLFLSRIEWQICAVVSSLISFIQIVRICILYKNERKGEIATLIIGILDICTGVLSVILVYVAIKAISTLLSGLKLFKASKVAIQGSKAIQLTKPVATKIARTVLPALSTYLLKLFNKKRSKEMSKKDTFITYLKNNPKTIIGIVASVITSLVCGGATSYGMVLGNIEIPLWAKVVIGAVVFLAFGFITILGTISGGWENNLKVETRKLAVKLGYENAVNLLEQAKEDYDKEVAIQLEKEKEEEERKIAMYKAQYVQQVNAGYLGSINDFIAEQQQKELEQKALQEKQEEEKQEAESKARWVEAIRLGQTDLGYEQWKKLN